jgi:hypothetical protein
MDEFADLEKLFYGFPPEPCGNDTQGKIWQRTSVHVNTSDASNASNAGNEFFIY